LSGKEEERKGWHIRRHFTRRRDDAPLHIERHRGVSEFFR
jgi:hypothetical protein